MNTKLTLTIEQSVIENAKVYAKARGRSLSDLIENYLKAVTNEPGDQDPGLSPRVKSLMGSFRLPDNFNYKENLVKALSEKYPYEKDSD
jgi:hypothetical protein